MKNPEKKKKKGVDKEVKIWYTDQVAARAGGRGNDPWKLNNKEKVQSITRKDMWKTISLIPLNKSKEKGKLSKETREANASK